MQKSIIQKAFYSFAIITLCLLWVFGNAIADKSGNSIDNPIQFKSKMMVSVSSQIREATDLTLTEDNRAVLAALLTLEYQVQEPNNKIDFTSPIFVAKFGTMASASFNTTKGYAIVIYQMNPLTTYYSYADSSDSRVAKAALEMSSDKVWEVPYDIYLEKLTALVQQISQ